MSASKGKPLLNKELAQLPSGSPVWSIYKRDGRTKWDEPFRIYREDDGSYSLLCPDVDRASWGPGEYFESDVSPEDPEAQAERDCHDGIQLFHVEGEL